MLELYIAINISRQMKCEWVLCQFESNSNEELYKHAIRAHSRAPYRCLWGDCRQLCHKSQGIKTHLLTHIPYRAYKCGFCRKGFKRHQELKRHVATIHTKDDKPQRSSISIDDLIHWWLYTLAVFVISHLYLSTKYWFKPGPLSLKHHDRTIPHYDHVRLRYRKSKSLAPTFSRDIPPCTIICHEGTRSN